MFRHIARFLQRRPTRVPDFDGRLPDVDPQSPHIQQLVNDLARYGDPQFADSILKCVTERMEAAFAVAQHKTHETLMQAHQEAVETETLLLAWTQRYRPRPPANREQNRLRRAYLEVLGYIAVLRLSFDDLPLPAGQQVVGAHVYIPIRDGIRSGPFCSHCLQSDRKAYLLAHSSHADVHLKCPNCQLP